MPNFQWCMNCMNSPFGCNLTPKVVHSVSFNIADWKINPPTFDGARKDGDVSNWPKFVA